MSDETLVQTTRTGRDPELDQKQAFSLVDRYWRSKLRQSKEKIGDLATEFDLSMTSILNYVDRHPEWNPASKDYAPPDDSII